jgi:hypothetical protein
MQSWKFYVVVEGGKDDDDVVIVFLLDGLSLVVMIAVNLMRNPLAMF